MMSRFYYMILDSGENATGDVASIEVGYTFNIPHNKGEWFQQTLSPSQTRQREHSPHHRMPT